MCEPTSLALLFGGLASGGAALLGNKPAAPPPIPATAPEAAKKPGATVRVGDGQDKNAVEGAPVALVDQTERRVFGRPVGGLGKSGLSI